MCEIGLAFVVSALETWGLIQFKTFVWNKMNESCQSLSIFEIPLEAVRITLIQSFKKKRMGDLPAILTVGINVVKIWLSPHIFYFEKKREKRKEKIVFWAVHYKRCH